MYLQQMFLLPRELKDLTQTRNLANQEDSHMLKRLMVIVKSQSLEGEEKHDKLKVRRIPSSKSWTKERAEAEADYKSEFTAKVLQYS